MACLQGDAHMLAPKQSKAWPRAIIALAIVLTLAWAGLLVWLPLRLLHYM